MLYVRCDVYVPSRPAGGAAADSGERGEIVRCCADATRYARYVVCGGVCRTPVCRDIPCRTTTGATCWISGVIAAGCRAFTCQAFACSVAAWNVADTTLFCAPTSDLRVLVVFHARCELDYVPHRLHCIAKLFHTDEVDKTLSRMGS